MNCVSYFVDYFFHGLVGSNVAQKRRTLMRCEVLPVIAEAGMQCNPVPASQKVPAIFSAKPEQEPHIPANINKPLRKHIAPIVCPSCIAQNTKRK